MAAPTKELPALPSFAPHVRIKGADRDKLVKLVIRHYKAGVSVREIGERMGRSYGFVHKMLLENKVALRARGGAQIKGSGVRAVAKPDKAEPVRASEAVMAATDGGRRTARGIRPQAK